MTMSRTMLALLVLLATASAGPRAAEPCREGATADGRCVRPGLAQAMRQQAILLTQPRLSYTVPPLPPAADPMPATLRPAFESQQFASPYDRRLPRR